MEICRLAAAASVCLSSLLSTRISATYDNTENFLKVRFYPACMIIGLEIGNK